MSSLINMRSLIYRSRKIPFIPVYQSIKFQSSSSVKLNQQSLNQHPGENQYTNPSDRYDDEKLKEIIETSNLGIESLRKRQMAEQEQMKRGIFNEEQKELEGKPTEEDANRLQNKKLQEKRENDIFKESKPENAMGSTSIALEGTDSYSNDINEYFQNGINNLPSQKEKRRNQLSKKLEMYLDSLQDTIFTATRALNDVTGYSAIEKLKKSIETLENELKDAKENFKFCKQSYSEAIQRRSLSQKEINELLTRKHSWSPDDLERFTNLYRNDHVNEQEELTAQENLNKAESMVDAIQIKLTQSILTRYHEEQIWSDKIRRASTWGTWILMGINIFLFFLATFLVEPWKRKRLVSSFEDKVKNVLIDIAQENDAKLSDLVFKPPESLIVESPKSSDAKIESPPNKSTHIFSFRLVENSWQCLQQILLNNYRALTSKDIQILQFDKIEFGVITTAFILLGCGLGSLLTTQFR